MKKLILCLCVTALLQNAKALQITEIMYDPSGSDTGHEWFEVYNDGEASVDLKTYKFFENSTSHTISYVSGAEMLQKGTYAIIADNASFFLLDNPNFTGSLFDSAFSFSNSGETIEMRTANGESASKVSYTPVPDSNGTGGTLSLINGSWLPGNSTPGDANVAFSGSVSTTPTSTSSATTQTSSNSYVQTTKRTYLLGDIHMLTNKEIFTTAGASTYFETRNADSKNTNIVGTVYWSFGDGAGAVGATSSHIYQNSGDYNAFLEVENSNVYGIEKVTVHVRDPKLKVYATSSGIVVENIDDEDIDIGGFNIMCDTGIFQIARHFLINKNSKVLISDKVLGFGCASPKLRFSNNTLVPEFYKNENKSIMFSLNEVKSSSTQHKRPLYKKVNLSNKVTSSQSATTTQTMEPTKQTQPSVGKSAPSAINKWLYWLYE